MKRLLVLVLVFAVLLSGFPANVSYAGPEYKETVLDKVWDWSTTLGKEGIEKDKIIAQNKAERLKRHAEKVAKQKKKEAEKAGKNMKKKLGL